MEMQNTVSKLLRFADVEGTEVGDACILLCELFRYHLYLSDEFNASAIQEITAQLKQFEDNFNIVEKTETHESTYFELEEKP